MHSGLFCVYLLVPVVVLYFLHALFALVAWQAVRLWLPPTPEIAQQQAMHRKAVDENDSTHTGKDAVKVPRTMKDAVKAPRTTKYMAKALCTEKAATEGAQRKPRATGGAT